MMTCDEKNKDLEILYYTAVGKYNINEGISYDESTILKQAISFITEYILSEIRLMKTNDKSTINLIREIIM